MTQAEGTAADAAAILRQLRAEVEAGRISGSREQMAFLDGAAYALALAASGADAD